MPSVRRLASASFWPLRWWLVWGKLLGAVCAHWSSSKTNASSADRFLSVSDFIVFSVDPGREGLTLLDPLQKCQVNFLWESSLILSLPFFSTSCQAGLY